MRALAVLLGAVVLCIATAAGAFAAWATGRVGGPDEGEYIAANERVLGSLPVFQGAVRVRRTSQAQYERPGWPYRVGPPTGWTTRDVYDVGDQGSWAQVRSFYLARLLPEWPLVSFNENHVTFVRDRTELLITSLTPSGKSYEVIVDRDCPPTCGPAQIVVRDAVVVELKPVAGSPLSGAAIVDSSAASTHIEVAVAPAGGTVAHVHRGSCSRPATSTLGEGERTILLFGRIAPTRSSRYHVDVHVRSGRGSRVAACGDLGPAPQP